MSGSAKAGTTAERHTCELRVLIASIVRAPPKRASGESFSPLPPSFDLSSCITQTGEPVRVQTFIPQPAVEAFYVRVLYGLSRLNKLQSHSALRSRPPVPDCETPARCPERWLPAVRARSQSDPARGALVIH